MIFYHNIKLIVGMAAVVFYTSNILAQQPDPNSPRYKGVMTLVSLINSSGDAPIRDFLKDKIAKDMRTTHSDAELIRMIGQLRSEFHEATMKGAMPAGPYSAEIMFSSQGSASRNSLTFELESKPPHRFIDFGYESPRDDVSNLTSNGLAAELHNHMRKLVKRDRFSGTVLVAKDGKPIFKEAYGLASKRFNVPNKIDTKLNLGSMNKMFTGVAICQLVEQGKLSFDDKVIQHLPDYPNRDVAEKVTIHQLLTHTSGLGSYWNDKYSATWTTIRTLNQLLPIFVDDPLQFEPGARFGYSNCGPVVLGLIIEKITGQSYYDYVRDHVYKPAGMTNTDCYAMDEPTPNLAIGYTNMGGGFSFEQSPRRNNLFSHSVKGGPAGGGFSTVEDLLKFSIALQEHKLLSPEMTDTMLAGKVAMRPGSMYAYLFGDKISRGHRLIGHNGGAPGISADFRFYPELGYTYAVLANYDQAAGGVGKFIARHIEREPTSPTATSHDDGERTVKSSGAPYRIGVMLIPNSDGMEVKSLVPGGPGEKAGLHEGDVIITINGITLDEQHMAVIAKAFATPAIATLEILRGDEKLTVKLKPERYEPEN